jgi:hypothetical protein
MQCAYTVLYCHLWHVRLYHVFPHYLINGMMFGKKLLNIKCVFWFSLQRLSETFLILRRIERDIIINVRRSSCKAPLTLVRFLMKLEFPRRIFEKYSKYQFSWNSVQWEPSTFYVPQQWMLSVKCVEQNEAHTSHQKLFTYVLCFASKLNGCEQTCQNF